MHLIQFYIHIGTQESDSLSLSTPAEPNGHLFIYQLLMFVGYMSTKQKRKNICHSIKSGRCKLQYVTDKLDANYKQCIFTVTYTV